MMLLIAGAVLVVVYLAVKSPDPNMATKTDVGPNQNVPMLGSVGNPSPAMSNGAPAASQVYRTAMTVNAGLVANDQRKIAASGTVRQLNATPGVFRPPTQTVAEMGKALMTMAPPSLAETTTPQPTFSRIKL